MTEGTELFLIAIGGFTVGFVLTSLLLAILGGGR